MKKRTLRVRRFLKYRFPILLLLLLQFLLLSLLWLHSCRWFWLRAGLHLLGIVIAFRIFCNPRSSAYAKPLIFLILLFPELGGFWYLVLHPRRLTVEKAFAHRFHHPAKKQSANSGYSPASAGFSSPASVYSAEKTLEKAIMSCPQAGRLMTFLQKTAGYPIFQEEATEYFRDAVAMRKALLADLQNAKQSVFLVFFILEDGIFWNSVKAVLLERAAAGVRVDLIYDDFGCFLSFSKREAALLQSAGIHCASFRPFHPRLSFLQNSRDHRKLVVIDDRIAYTGGINLTDEYLGISERFCDWKDCAVRVCGSAAGSFAEMFRSMWKRLTSESPSRLPRRDLKAPETSTWIQPFASSPTECIAVWEEVFLHLAEYAELRLWIATPYLTAGDGIFSALRRVAECGVDVRLLVPGEADKPLVQFTSRSYYAELVKSGVQIYEYGSGFLHQKLFLCDGDIAVVGSANLDFRSLYFQEECGTVFYHSPEIANMEEDFLHSLSVSRQISKAESAFPALWRGLSRLCRLIAPLM